MRPCEVWCRWPADPSPPHPGLPETIKTALSPAASATVPEPLSGRSEAEGPIATAAAGGADDRAERRAAKAAAKAANVAAATAALDAYASRERAVLVAPEGEGSARHEGRMLELREQRARDALDVGAAAGRSSAGGSSSSSSSAAAASSSSSSSSAAAAGGGGEGRRRSSRRRRKRQFHGDFVSWSPPDAGWHDVMELANLLGMELGRDADLHREAVSHAHLTPPIRSA